MNCNVSIAVADLEFRQVHSDCDIGMVVQLAGKIWNECYPPLIGQAQVDYMLGSLQSVCAIRRQIESGVLYYLILLENVPSGYVAVRCDVEDSCLFLSKLYVLAEQRGRGLGRGALAFAEAYARKHALQLICLNVNRGNLSAISWYRHVGFRQTDRIVVDIGGGYVMDDFRMEKSVST